MKKIALILSFIMIIAMTAGMGFAADKTAAKAKMVTLTAEVVKVDATAGTIVIKVKNAEQTLKAEPKMLEGIAVGQKVAIEKVGDVVKSIKAE